MDGFDDAVTGRSVRRNGYGSDPSVAQRKLKVVAVKFAAIIVDAAERPRVATQPDVPKVVPGFFGCCGGLKNDFNKVSNRLDTGEGSKLQFLTIDSNFPGSDTVDMDLVPRVADGFAWS